MHQDKKLPARAAPIWCAMRGADPALDDKYWLWQGEPRRYHIEQHMKPIYIFRHLACEGPGYLTTFLQAHHVAHQIIAVDHGDVIPADLSGTSGLIFMGGSMSVNDPLPWIEAELRLIRQAYMVKMPVLGHCLGGQLIAKAMGAKVERNRVKEIGWHSVEKRSDESSWFAAMPERFDVFHWHGETFDIPSGATPLLRSAWCENQAFVIGAALALQFHIEMTAAMVEEWTEMNREELLPESDSVQSPEAIVAELPTRIAALRQVADVVYSHWLSQVLHYNGTRN